MLPQASVTITLYVVVPDGVIANVFPACGGVKPTPSPNSYVYGAPPPNTVAVRVVEPPVHTSAPPNVTVGNVPASTLTVAVAVHPPG